jgi:hypothetical protein
MVYLPALMLAAALPQAWAQPANDDFANATVLVGSQGTYAGSTLGATREPSEPIHFTSGQPSVWFRWVAPVAGVAIFDTRGSVFDTLLAGYSGATLDSLITLDSDDDRGGNLTSLIGFNVEAGLEYFIAVDGYFGSSGNY